jgi:C-terminal processing protease CtpA/Prc
VRDSMFVTAVAEDSPAERAGLRQGDWITLIDGNRANPTTLSEKPPVPGTNLKLTVRRGSRNLDLSMAAVEAPAGTYAPTRLVPTMADTVALEARALRGKMALQATKAPTMKITPTDSFGSVDIASVSPARRKTQPLRMSDIAISDTMGRLVKDPELYEQLKVSIKEMDGMLKKLAMSRDNALAGAEFEELNPGLAEYFGGASSGVFVLRSAELAPASRAGLRPGDIVERVNGTEVSTIRELRTLVSEASGPITLDVIRKGRAMSMIIETLGAVRKEPPNDSR